MGSEAGSEELQFDLFAEGDVEERYRAAAGLPAPTEEEGDTGNEVSRTDGPGGDTEPPAQEISPPEPVLADVVLAALAAACAYFALPPPPAVVHGIAGLWMTRCGNKLRVQYNKLRRAEVVTMGIHTIPVLGAVLRDPCAASGAAATATATTPPRDARAFDVGTKVVYSHRTYTVEGVNEKENLLQIAGGVDVPMAKVAPAKRWGDVGESPMRGALKPSKVGGGQRARPRGRGRAPTSPGADGGTRRSARGGGALARLMTAACEEGRALRSAKCAVNVGDLVAYRMRPYTVKTLPPRRNVNADVEIVPVYKAAGYCQPIVSKWVGAHKLAPLPYCVGDAVRVALAPPLTAGGGEDGSPADTEPTAKHEALVVATSPVFQVALRHARGKRRILKIQHIQQIEHDARVSFMGARLLPTSTPHTLVFSDGDVWERVRQRRACVSCHADLAYTTRLPADYKGVFYCSLCGQGEPVECGSFHCGTCFFDVCCGCVEHLTVQYPPDPPVALTCAPVRCSMCDAGPFCLDDAYGHWLQLCPHNPYAGFPTAARGTSSGQRPGGGGLCASVKTLRRIRQSDAARLYDSATEPSDTLWRKRIAHHAAPHANWVDGLVDADGEPLSVADDGDGDGDDGEALLTMAQKRSVHTVCYLTDSTAVLEETLGKTFGGYPLKEVLNKVGKASFAGAEYGVQVVKRMKDGEYGPEEVTSVEVSVRGEPVPPLFLACMNARHDVARWLLVRGADPTHALHGMVDGRRVTIIGAMRRAGFKAFEMMLCGAVLARTPLCIKVVDLHGEAVLSCPADLLHSGRQATTLTQRLERYTSHPYPLGLVARFEWFPRHAARPSGCVEPAEPVQTTAALSAFVDVLMQEEPAGDPLPDGVHPATLATLRRHVREHRVIHALSLQGEVGAAKPAWFAG